MNTPYEDLIKYLTSSNAEFRLLEHAPCRSSAESAAARASAGVHDAIGAKALIVLLGDNSAPSIVVLPGPLKVDSKVLRKRFGRVRFANILELATATGGLEPGMVPPFAKPVFSRIDSLYVDSALAKHNAIGFNAACLNKSIVMDLSTYVAICNATDTFHLSIVE